VVVELLSSEVGVVVQVEGQISKSGLTFWLVLYQAGSSSDTAATSETKGNLRRQKCMSSINFKIFGSGDRDEGDDARSIQSKNFTYTA
jgi:hypothetical protein